MGTEMNGPFYRADIPEYPGAVYGFPQTDTAELRVNGCAVPVMAEAQKTSEERAAPITGFWN